MWGHTQGPGGGSSRDRKLHKVSPNTHTHTHTAMSPRPPDMYQHKLLSSPSNFLRAENRGETPNTAENSPTPYFSFLVGIQRVMAGDENTWIKCYELPNEVGRWTPARPEAYSSAIMTRKRGGGGAGEAWTTTEQNPTSFTFPPTPQSRRRIVHRRHK